MSKNLRPNRIWLALAALAGMAAWAAAPQNLSRALEAQRALVAAQPANASVRVDLGNLLLLAHDTDGAEAAYRKATEIDAKNVAAHFDLGLLLQRKGENSGALRAFKKVLELDPKHAWAHYRRGEIEEGRGMESAAVRSYARAFALDPSLRFADVNPSIIDNHLLTRSLLLAYRDYAPEREPPVLFEEPGRIVDLLLTPRKAAASDPSNGATRQAAGSAQSGVSISRPPGVGAVGSVDSAAAGDATASKGPSFVRVLSAEDLDTSGHSGQVAPAQGAPNRGLEINNSPRNAYYPPPVYTPNAPQPEEGQPATYYPGAPSTGRMDLKLYPRRPRNHALFVAGAPAG